MRAHSQEKQTIYAQKIPGSHQPGARVGGTHLLGRVSLRRGAAGWPEPRDERRQPLLLQPRAPTRVRLRRARRRVRLRLRDEQQEERGEEAAGHGERGGEE